MQATANTGGVQPQGADAPPIDDRQTLLQNLLAKRREAIAGRAGSGIEEEWTEDEEHYQGIDDANRAFQSANMLYRSRSKALLSGQQQGQQPTRSVVFLNITRPYVDAASARVADMLLPTDDRAWEIKATPLPTLSQLQLTKLAEAMRMPSTEAVQEAMEQQAQLAQEAATKMQKAIEDPLVESNWHGEVRQVIEDAARCGSGVLKGPFPVMRTVRMTRQDPVTQLKTQFKVDEIKPGSKRIDFWNFFPDPACGENIHAGSFTFEREYIGKRQIMDLLKDESYDRAELLAVLREGPAKTREGTESVYRHGDDEFEMWIFHGHCMRQQLQAMGVELDEGAEEQLPAMAVMINDRLVKAVLSPLESGEFPYDVLAWQRRPGMPWGIGVSRQIRTVQRMLVASTRAMMDNSGLSAAPQVVISNGITPVDGVYTLRPGKLWRAEAGSDVPDVTKAFASFSVTSVQNELMNIINFALKMAEDTTGMPAMLQGIRGDAPQTLGGMQMQNNNATSVLRRLAKRFDDYMTRPHIQRYFDWMMSYSDDDNIKGDFEIEVRASSALVERDAQQQFLMSLLQASANPMYDLDPAKLAAELCRGQRLDPKNFQLTDEQKAQRAQQGQDPTLQAKAQLLGAQAIKAQADAERAQALTVGARVEAQYSAVQTAQVIEQIPGTATTADALLRSAGSIDMDAAPIVPQASGAGEVPPVEVPTNTNPLTPANPASPAVGMQVGIETQADDGVRS
ncbi:portal protein [Comamonas jiangduensis]|uniref:portal protein n=1 Tax=Comamonas jiangduensis TaxID=1194168 RepID=UPI003BF780F7